VSAPLRLGANRQASVLDQQTGKRGGGDFASSLVFVSYRAGSDQASAQFCARTTLAIVSQVRVVTSFPNVFSISAMKPALRTRRYALKISLPFMVRMRAPSDSMGN